MTFIVNRLRFSIGTILGLVVGLMGALGLMLALISGVVHRNLTVENQRDSLVKLVRLKVHDLLGDLTDRSRDLGLALQSDANFRHAFEADERLTLVRLLNNQFHQYFVTADIIKLEKLVVLDINFNKTAESSEPSTIGDTGQVFCPRLIKLAGQRQGAQRTKILSDLCLFDQRPYHTVMVTIGGLRPMGYLLVITDPAQSLIPAETDLGMPLRLTLPQGRVVYQSGSWPALKTANNNLLAQYLLDTPAHEPALSIAVIQDHKPLYERLGRARLVVMLVACTITLLAVVIVMWVLRKTTLTPLSALTKQLRLLRKDRLYLGQRVSIGGTAEIKELAGDFNDMTSELHGLYETLESMAYTDTLTNLPNRNSFHDHLQAYIQNHHKSQQCFALFLMDLDRFKGVNDTLGHHVGDRLLQKVGARLQHALRHSDMVAHVDGKSVNQFAIARLGGDEFAAILPVGNNLNDETMVARKLISAMEQPFVIDSYRFIIGVSVGIALYPEDGEDEHTIMRKADIAMYHAKKTKSGFAFYAREHDLNSLLHLTLERDLLHAINHNQLLLYYQPKINLRTGIVCGAEALVRWQHPDQGMIAPAEFISLAEQSGLIQPMAGWVLNKALEHCAIWQKDGHPSGVSVNLSALNLHDRDITDTITEALAKWSIAPHDLTLELTESAVMSDPIYALKVLSQLDVMGIGLAIDDFGIGHSSLAYIKQLPVDEIKIDKSFIKEMGQDSSDEAIVRSVIVLAHHLHLTVVAEGVEEQQPWHKLKELDCDVIQGNYIAEPMPFDEYRDWLEHQNRTHSNVTRIVRK